MDARQPCRSWFRIERSHAGRLFDRIPAPEKGLAAGAFKRPAGGTRRPFNGRAPMTATLERVRSLCDTAIKAANMATCFGHHERLPLAAQGFRNARKRVGTPWHSWLRVTRKKKITYQTRPAAASSPALSGRAPARGRRYSAFRTSSAASRGTRSRVACSSTSTDWMMDYSESLPIFRSAARPGAHLR